MKSTVQSSHCMKKNYCFTKFANWWHMSPSLAHFCDLFWSEAIWDLLNKARVDWCNRFPEHKWETWPSSVIVVSSTKKKYDTPLAVYYFSPNLFLLKYKMK
jgi:hypothetical protein